MSATRSLSGGKCHISCNRDHTRVVTERFFTKISPAAAERAALVMVAVLVAVVTQRRDAAVTLRWGKWVPAWSPESSLRWQKDRMVSNHQTRRFSGLREEMIRCNCHHGIREKKKEGRWKERTVFDIKGHLDLEAARDIKQEVEEASLAQASARLAMELVASAVEDFREVLWEDRWGLEQEFPELVLAMEVEVEVEEKAEEEHFTKEQPVFKLEVSEDQPPGSLPPLEGENPQNYLLFNSKFQLAALNFKLEA